MSVDKERLKDVLSKSSRIRAALNETAGYAKKVVQTSFGTVLLDTKGIKKAAYGMRLDLIDLHMQGTADRLFPNKTEEHLAKAEVAEQEPIKTDEKNLEIPDTDIYREHITHRASSLEERVTPLEGQTIVNFDGATMRVDILKKIAWRAKKDLEEANNARQKSQQP